MTACLTRLFSVEGRQPHGQDIHRHAFCSCALDLDPMTLIRERPRYSEEIHAYQNERFVLTFKPLEHCRQTDRQTDRPTDGHTGRFDLKHYHSHVVNIKHLGNFM